VRQRILLSDKERLVLELLVTTPSKYGLQLVDESRGRLKRGTVYVTLGRMEEKGLVESEQEPTPPGQGGLPRRHYRATGHGIRLLEANEAMARTLSDGREWVMDAQ
jgi:DNA-binding PadR family transcriptional regulator